MSSDDQSYFIRPPGVPMEVLTKREVFVAFAMAGVLAADSSDSLTREIVRKRTFLFADDILNALNISGAIAPSILAAARKVVAARNSDGSWDDLKNAIGELEDLII